MSHYFECHEAVLGAQPQAFSVSAAVAGASSGVARAGRAFDSITIMSANGDANASCFPHPFFDASFSGKQRACMHHCCCCCGADWLLLLLSRLALSAQSK
jgi:hypothetical protein